jgi:type I restriction enzyme R subunit
LEKLDCLNKAVEFVQTTESVEKRFMALVKKLRSAYNLSCSSEEITHQEKDQIHFYFAVKSILHKLTR